MSQIKETQHSLFQQFQPKPRCWQQENVSRVILLVLPQLVPAKRPAKGASTANSTKRKLKKKKRKERIPKQYLEVGIKLILTPSVSSFVRVSFYDPPLPPTSGVFPRAWEQRVAGGRASSPGETKSPAQAQPVAAPAAARPLPRAGS